MTGRLILFVCIVAVTANDISIYKLTISDEDKQLTFEYLDKDGDGKINKQEVQRLFNHHEDAAEITSKFISLLDGHDADKDISPDELNKFIDDKAVTFAAYECSFEFSYSLKKQCFEDRIITFVHLVLPKVVIQTFYKKFEHNSDNTIGLQQVKKLFTDGSEAQQADNVKNFMLEIGGSDKVITESEFTTYVRQGDLHDDFRACLGKNKDYNYECLVNSLVKFTTNSLTEMDIAMIFGTLDTDGDNMIESADLMAPDGCNAPCEPERFLTMMDNEDKDSIVTYEEFRTFIKKNTVRIRVEKSCTEKYESQAKELECYRREIFRVVAEHHQPVWLTLPRADMVLLFETLDVDNDGQIEVLDDLVHLGCPEDIAKKLVREMDENDKGKNLNFQEFNEFMDDPSVIYTLSQCKRQARGKSRTECYKEHLIGYIRRIPEKQDVVSLFRLYDKTGKNYIYTDYVHDIIKKGDDIDEFFDEIGMGDHIINKAEFGWYIKQEEISTMLQEAKCNGDPEKMHIELMTYLKTRITELNIQSLFEDLFAAANWLLDHVKIKRVENGKGLYKNFRDNTLP